MNIIISTVRRKKNIINKTIQSIRAETMDTIYLVVGKSDINYLKEYFNRKDIVILVDDTDFEDSLKDGVQRAGYGYTRCLGLNKDIGALIIEDDVVLKAGWYSVLNTFVETLKDDKYIISLTIPFEDSVALPKMKTPSLQLYEYAAKLIPDEKRTHYALSVRTFANTSAVYYPSSVLKTDLSQFITDNVVRGEGVYDLAIGQYLFDQKIPIYISVPVLAENRGTVSAMGSPEKRYHVNYVFGGINYVNG